MGQVIMLGTLFGLIVARSSGWCFASTPKRVVRAGARGRAVNDELTPLLTAADRLRLRRRVRASSSPACT